jgi:hypothetical protein
MVPALRARPQPEEAADHGIDVVMVSGFFGTKEDFRELLALLAQAGYGGWAYDYQGHRERRQAAARPFIPRQLGTFRSGLDDIDAGGPAGRLPVPAGGPGGAVGAAVRVAVPRPAADDTGRRGDPARAPGPPGRARLRAVRDGRAASPRRPAGPELVARLAAIVTRQGDRGMLAHLTAGHTETERLGAAVLLFGAGFDSPASMVGLGTKLLLDHPRQAALVREQATIAPQAVAEILRFDAAGAARRPGGAGASRAVGYRDRAGRHGVRPGGGG